MSNLLPTTWGDILFDSFRWWRKFRGGKWERWWVDVVYADSWHRVTELAGHVYRDEPKAGDTLDA